MLQSLMVVAAMSGPMPIMEELKADLEKHRKRAALGSTDELGDRKAILQTTTQRSWLSYNPDALLPIPFDVFLLSGSCPRIPWAPSADVISKEPELCYIVGCGRSGTTFLGDLLSRYQGLVFLNEPRQLWIPLLPAMDVWSAAAPKRQGRLTFTRAEALLEVPTLEAGGESRQLASTICGAYRDLAEVVPVSTSKGAESLGPEVGRVVIVEKFPEHAFRLEFLSSICGKGLGPRRCKFIHMTRDGVDVARSVARFGNEASWYGVKGTKWQLLSAFPLGLSADFSAHLESRDLGVRLFSRGLVEWALSLETARTDAGNVRDESPCLEVRYEDLLADPSAALLAIEEFLGIEHSAEVHRCAVETSRRREAEPLTAAEADVLRTLRGSRIETLLREWGRDLPQP